MKVIQTQKAFKAHEETKLLEKITQIALFFFLEFKTFGKCETEFEHPGRSLKPFSSVYLVKDGKTFSYITEHVWNALLKYPSSVRSRGLAFSWFGKEILNY